MAATASPGGPRKTISVYDYPEHLNPFHEEDHHNKIRFWTIGRKLNRSNSISFSGIKDLKNSWALRSFMKKGKKGQQTNSQANKSNGQANGENSPIIYRRALQYSTATGARSTVASPERTDRYVYGGSVTPLPRSRFQERLRSPSQPEVESLSVTPRMARSEVTGSRLSVESTNPFDECPVPPVRASRRKKKRAPPPPPGVADVSINSANSELSDIEHDKTRVSTDADLEPEEINLNVELKIVEDEDFKSNDKKTSTTLDTITTTEQPTLNEKQNNNATHAEDENRNVQTLNILKDEVTSVTPEENTLNKVSFPKIDIVKYRRNSSLNEDDIRLRRGNLEDFHQISGKRSKSLSNTFDANYDTYDIDLNENRMVKDANSNVEPQKVICKVYNETSRKQSIDNSISSTEKEFIEIDKATRDLEREISKLNSALNEDDNDKSLHGVQMSFSEIRRKFDRPTSPNPIPKPRRSHYGDSIAPVNGNYQT